MKAHPLRALIACLVVVYGLVLATVLTDNTPKLGLDLQGGSSILLEVDTAAVLKEQMSDLENIGDLIDVFIEDARRIGGAI